MAPRQFQAQPAPSQPDPSVPHSPAWQQGCWAWSSDIMAARSMRLQHSYHSMWRTRQRCLLYLADVPDGFTTSHCGLRMVGRTSVPQPGGRRVGGTAQAAAGGCPGLGVQEGGMVVLPGRGIGWVTATWGCRQGCSPGRAPTHRTHPQAGTAPCASARQSLVTPQGPEGGP